MIVATGPNASTSCTACARRADRRSAAAPAARRRRARRRRRRPRNGRDRRRPSFGLRASSATCSQHVARAGRGSTSGPIRTLSSSGSPIVTFGKRARAAPRSPRRATARGTSARRIAVHFCPAFTVISLRHFLDEQIELRRAGRGVRARIAALSESRSAMKRTASRAITGWRCSFVRGRGRAGERHHVLARSGDRTDRRSSRR